MPVTEEEMLRYEEPQEAWERPAILCAPDGAATNISFLDATYSDNGSFTKPPEEGTLSDNTEITSWFKKGEELLPGTHRLRLIYGTIAKRSLPITQKDAVVISDYLNLNLHSWKSLYRPLADCVSFQSDRRQVNDVCNVFRVHSEVLMYEYSIEMDDYVNTSIFIHHRPSTKVTHGLLLMNVHNANFDESIVRDTALQIMSSFEDLEYHPISTLMAVCKEALSENARGLIHVDNKIDESGAHLGYAGAHGKVGDPLADSAAMTLTKNTEEVQRNALHVGTVSDHAGRQRVIIKRLLSELEYERDGATKRELHRLLDIKRALLDIEGGNDAVISCAQSQQAQISSLAQALFNFLTIKEGRVNIELAKSSKEIAEATMRDSAAMKTIAELTRKDSSAMKSIAVLTMVFLPATAVASVLDTPFFDWDSTTSRLTTQGFWIFWATSIPLTIAVLTIWLLGVKLNWTTWLASFVRHWPFTRARKRQRVAEMNGAMFEMINKMV